VPADIGINFRNSAGFVTDGTNETYCLSTDSYPTSRGGGTFGWDTGAEDDRDRDSGVDRRFAGINFSNYNSSDIWRLDLDSAVQHTVHVAAGDTSFVSDAQYGQGRDNTTAFFTLDNVDSQATDTYRDTTDVARAEATWDADEVPAVRTFASTIFRYAIGKGSGVANNSKLAHIRVEDTSAAAPAPSLTDSVSVAEAVNPNLIIMPQVEE